MNSDTEHLAKNGEIPPAMITKAPQSSLKVWAAPLALIAFLLCTELLGDWGRQALRYERVLIASGEWWRFLTGNFVHLGWYHWFLNEMGLVVLVLLCPDQLSPAVWARRVILLGLGMSAGLYWMVPGLTNYVGMSGVIHGLFVLGLMPQVMKKDLIALGCLTYLLGKLAYELYSGAPVSDQEALGGVVVTESHFYGSIAAFIYGLVFQTFTRVETWSRKSP